MPILFCLKSTEVETSKREKRETMPVSFTFGFIVIIIQTVIKNLLEF